MPIMDGLEATKRLRLHEIEGGLEEGKRQKIIGISANTGESMGEEALLVGMNAFMPVSILNECFKHMVVLLIYCYMFDIL